MCAKCKSPAKTMAYLDDLFTEVFGEVVVTLQGAWCPECGSTGMEQDGACTLCGGPAFTSEDDYNAYVHG